MSDIESRHEAADALIGMFIVMPPVLDEAIADHGIRPEHFDLAEHRTLFEALTAMRDQGTNIDHPRVTAWIDQQIAAGRQPWATHGRQRALEMLDTWADSPWLYISRVASLVDILRTEHRWDVRHDALRRGQRAIRDRDDDAFAMALDTAAEADDDVEDEIITAEQLGSEFIDWYQDANTGAIPTPFPRLSEMLAGGWLPGATTIVAAWSSMGKSVLVDQFAAHVTSPEVGKRSCVYINEMVRQTRTARTVSRMTGVPFKRIMRKQLDDAEMRKVVKAAGTLPFPLKEIHGKSADDIARHIIKHKWDVWVVDLVTRIPARDTADWDYISGRLTDVALKTGTHGILVCQLNQERNKTLIKPVPVQRDLRNTGSWYNDATNVIFLHREQEELTDNQGRGLGKAVALPDGYITVDKSRNDACGMLDVTFNPRTMSFETADAYNGWRREAA